MRVATVGISIWKLFMEHKANFINLYRKFFPTSKHQNMTM